MKCDRCGEQIPIGDEIDHREQTLCLECALRGLSPIHIIDTRVLRSAQLQSPNPDNYSFLIGNYSSTLEAGVQKMVKPFFEHPPNIVL